MNRDGSGLRRVTNSPAIDVTPTWSPTGQQIAFVSDRTGPPQIYVVNIDGTGLKKITNETACDRPTWSPAPFNEIAYTSQSGGGHDIRVYEFATGQTRTITDGTGSNESPAFSPNGRHIAFSSDRSGPRAGLRHRPRRQEPSADHEDRTESVSELVAIERHPTTRMSASDEKRESMKSRRVSAVVVAIALAPASARVPRRSRRWPGPCPRRRPPVTRSRPPPPAPPEPVRETPMPPEPLASDPLTATDIDLINKNSPFQPVFFALRQRRGRCGRAESPEHERRDSAKVSDVGDHDRRARRRARHGRVQPRARRAPRGGRAHLPRLARHPGRSAEDRELRQGVPVRSRPRRVGVGEEPPRALRRDVEVGPRFRTPSLNRWISAGPESDDESRTTDCVGFLER